MSRWSRLVLGVVLLVAAVLAWRWLFPSEEARIRHRLDALVEDANGMTQDLAGLAAAAKLGFYFTEDVAIDPGGGIQPLRGREIILSAASRLRPSADDVEFAIDDVDVTLAPDGQSAAVSLTALLTRIPSTGEITTEAHEFMLTMTKRESDWLISHVTAVDTSR